MRADLDSLSLISNCIDAIFISAPPFHLYFLY
jgi:hypothetical protein